MSLQKELSFLTPATSLSLPAMMVIVFQSNFGKIFVIIKCIWLTSIDCYLLKDAMVKMIVLMNLMSRTAKLFTGKEETRTPTQKPFLQGRWMKM